MDYGQPVNSSGESPFFTAGAGNASEKVNPDSEKSLNSNSYSQEHKSRDMGNTAISISEHIPESETLQSSPQPSAENLTAPNESLQEQPENPQNQELGKIVNLEMPPGAEENSSDQDAKDAKDTKETEIIDFSQIAHEKDRIAPKTVRAMEKAEIDLKSGKISPADLVEAKQHATEAYIKKAFGDKANWTGEEAA